MNCDRGLILNMMSGPLTAVCERDAEHEGDHEARVDGWATRPRPDLGPFHVDGRAIYPVTIRWAGP